MIMSVATTIQRKHDGEKQALQRALSQTGEMLVLLQIIFAE
jgi:hypothetical protein